MLTPDDRARIAAAIAAAEARTAGEITLVLTREVSRYAHVPLAWAAAAALTLPLALAFAGWDPGDLAAFGAWRAGHGAEGVRQTLIGYALTQGAIFLIAAAVVALPAVRRALTPRGHVIERVHRAALEQFLARGLHQTDARTGVLIFVATHERCAEIVADEGVYARAERTVWRETVAALVADLRRGAVADGLVAAVERCGAVLAEHAPPTGANPNELPDRIIEL